MGASSKDAAQCGQEDLGVRGLRRRGRRDQPWGGGLSRPEGVGSKRWLSLGHSHMQVRPAAGLSSCQWQVKSKSPCRGIASSADRHPVLPVF